MLVARGVDCHAMRRELETSLHERFRIDHTTLQVDHSRGDEPARRAAAKSLAIALDELEDALPGVLGRVGELLLLAVEEAVRRARRR